MKKLLLAATVLGALVSPASAVEILTLVGPIQSNVVGPQSDSAPCVIAATQCQQPAGFGFNNFTASGADSAYNMYSTTPTATVADGVQGTPYTVGQIDAVLPGNNAPFVVAIDVNTTNAAGETLQLFEVIVNGIVAYSYTGPTPIGNIANNGNGYGDWALGLIDLSSYASTATVLFHAVWDHASDGGESFFLVAASACPECVPTQVPGPIVGAGLPGLIMAVGGLLVFARRRRRNALMA